MLQKSAAAVDCDRGSEATTARAKGKQWLILQETLDAVYNAGVPVLLQQEIRLIKDEYDDALMKAELIECMTESEHYGNVGSFDVNDVDPSPIETAIVNAKKIKPKTLETQTLLKTALLCLLFERKCCLRITQSG